MKLRKHIQRRTVYIAVWSKPSGAKHKESKSIALYETSVTEVYGAIVSAIKKLVEP